MMSKCARCGDPVLRVALSDKSRTKDPRGRAEEVWIEVDPEPSPKGNVLIKDDRGAYVTNWDVVNYYALNVYRRHGLSCPDPLGLKWI